MPKLHRVQNKRCCWCRVVGIVCGGERQRVAIVYSLAAGATATAATTTTIQTTTTVSFTSSSSSSIRCCFGFGGVVILKKKRKNTNARTNARERETPKNQEQTKNEDNNMAAAAKSLSRGAFILFEGVDRCGKTTQASKLVESLNQSGVAARVVEIPGPNDDDWKNDRRLLAV